jgi:hypothetical protein
MSTAKVTRDYGVKESTVFLIKKRNHNQLKGQGQCSITWAKIYIFLIHHDPYLEIVKRTSYAWMENEDGNSRSIIRKECE